MIPPKVGPIAGAAAVTKEPHPIIKPRSLFGDSSKMMLYIIGSAIPTPAPCINLPISNKVNCCAKTSTINPIENKNPAVKNNFFV